MARTVRVVRRRDGHPIPGIAVSDGRQIATTDDRGLAELPGDRPLVFVHRPQGFVCDQWWFHADRGGEPVFALDEVVESPIVRFAHVTDLHLSEAVETASNGLGPLRRPRPDHPDPTEEAAAMRELATAREIRELFVELGAPHAGNDFIIATGDLTDRSTEWELSTYAQLIDRCGAPVYSIPGNHDLLDPSGGHGRLHPSVYERHLGPRWYSFDHGDLHVVAIDSSEWRWGDDNDAQRHWLAGDLARNRGRAIVVLTHDQLDETFYDHFPEPPLATFSGHWHTSRVVRDRAGTLHVNSGPPFMGGLDWSAPHHRIITWDGSTLRLDTVARSGSEDTEASTTPGWFGFRAGEGSELASASTWAHRTPGSTYRLPIVVGDGVALAASRDDDRSQGWLDAIDLDTGELRWREVVPEPVKASPIVVGDVAVVVTVAGRVMALDVADGSRRWENLPASWLRHWCVLRPVSDGDTVAVGDVAGYRGLGLLDGALRWNRTDLGAHINHVAYAQPVVVDGVSILGFWPQGPGLQAVELSDGSSRWPCASPREAYRTARWGEHMDQAASGGLCIDPDEPGAYAALSGGDIVRVDARDGAITWRTPVGGLFQAAEPVVAGEALIVTAFGRGVHALDRRTGAHLWTHRVAATASPALAPYWRHGRAVHAGATVVGDRVVLPLRQGRIEVLSLDDGELAGAVDLGIELTESLVPVEGGLLAAAVDGTIQRLDQTVVLGEAARSAA